MLNFKKNNDHSASHTVQSDLFLRINDHCGHMYLHPSRVAIWHIFEPKIPIWVKFGGSYNWRCMTIPSTYIHIGICRLFSIFVIIWYILWLFGIFSPILVCCTKKNLATLHPARKKPKLESNLRRLSIPVHGDLRARWRRRAGSALAHNLRTN
jgi:hypothetical protein